MSPSNKTPPHPSPVAPENEALAGFSSESDANGSFCQMIKELVDNSIDSISSADSSSLHGGGQSATSSVGLKGTINVTIERDDSSAARGHLRLTVSDDGIGMSSPIDHANAFITSKRRRLRCAIEGQRGEEDAQEGKGGNHHRASKRSRLGNETGVGLDGFDYDSLGMPRIVAHASGKSWSCAVCGRWFLAIENARKHDCQGGEGRDQEDDDDSSYGSEDAFRGERGKNGERENGTVFLIVFNAKPRLCLPPLNT